MQSRICQLSLKEQPWALTRAQLAVFQCQLVSYQLETLSQQQETPVQLKVMVEFQDPSQTLDQVQLPICKGSMIPSNGVISSRHRTSMMTWCQSIQLAVRDM